MLKTSKYIWRIINLLLFVSLCAPSFSAAKDKEKKTEEKPQTVLYGLYVDLDVMDPIIHIFDNSRNGLSASAELDLFHRLYPTFVAGYQKFDASDKYDYPVPSDKIRYEVSGMYYKVGVSCNVWKKNYFKKINPISYVGLNFAWSSKFSSKLDGYPLSNEYWEDSENEMSYFSYDKKNDAIWLDIFVGMKAPVAKHFCLGAEVMFKPVLRIDAENGDGYQVHHSYAPGYGSKINSKWGFRYTLSYYFSFFDKEPADVDEY